MNRWNSTIQQKVGLCIDCNDGKEKPIIAGRCVAFHYNKFRQEERLKKSNQRTMTGIEKIKEGVLDAWFRDRRREMTGRCVICGGKTLKDNDKEYKRSIHHLLAKRESQFPSVATNVFNWLEVCFYGNSCHTNIENGMISWEKLKEQDHVWDIIVTRFKKVYPHIEPSETKNLPEILLSEL